MCDCREEIDKKLAEHNGRLATGFSMSRNGGELDLVLLMQVEKINAKSRKKPPAVIPTFCPFCGEKLMKDAA